jgi:2,4-dienoyl-CoA reductase-like NADH-dependent reductase (Old Yellow Enzyme family)
MSADELLAARPFPLADGLVLRNRLVGTAHAAGLVSDGLVLPADAEYWRRRAAGGAAMLTVGGTAAAAESTWRRRIVTEAWREEAVPGMAARAQAIRGEGAVAACQLVHLGRETTGAEIWYHPVAPSAVRSPREPTRPRSLTDGEADAIVEGFRVSAVNAVAAGLQVIELHAAHGYLLHQFLSPLSNHRTDAYGGSFDGRVRLTLETVAAVRKAWPGDLPLAVRLSCTDWEPGGWDLEQSVELARRLKGLGVDLIDCSSGGATPTAKIPAGPGYQVPFAEAIRAQAGVATAAVGLITEPAQAEEILERGRADLVLLARATLRDPYCPVHAAKALGVPDACKLPRQYGRA